jgi:oligopeptide transport system substrate-binding protein
MRTRKMLTKCDGVRLRPGLSREEFLKLGGASLAGAALLGTAGCGSVFSGGSGGGGSSDNVKQNMIWNIGDTIRDMDTTTTTDTASFDIILNVMSGLYRLDPDARPVPDLAEGVDISSDKLDYTFTLRDGIKWSNGDPVTSNDFKYAWLRVLDPKTASQYSYIISTFVKGALEYNTGKGSAGDVAIEAPDDKTLKVTLLAPSPFWLGLTAFFTYMPQNQKFVEEQGDNYAQNVDGLITNGPYLLTDFKPTEGCTMVKYKDYWNADNVQIEKNEGKIVKDENTAVNLYNTGEMDETEIHGEYINEYKGKPDFATKTFFATFNFSWNYDEPLFQNLNVRKAILMGVDLKTLTNDINNNGSLPATGYVPDGMAGPGKQTFREAEGPTMPAYDVAKAKDLFQQGIKEVGDNPTIELLSYDDSVARDIATFFQSQLKKIGLKTTIKIQPFDRKLELEANGSFQLSFQGWIGDYNDPMTFLDLWTSDSSFNTGKYSNADYDKLIGDAKVEADFAKRMDMLLEAEKLLIEDDAALAPLYFDGRSYLLRPTITRFVNLPYGGGRDISLWTVKS